MSVYSELLRSALDEYDAIMQSDYDSKFASYSKVVKNGWESDLDEFSRHGSVLGPRVASERQRHVEKRVHT